MDEKRSFENFFDSISLDSLSEYQSSIESLTKLLNKKYYDSDSVDDHCLVVGSVGRQTAVSETSDLDLLFVLPQEVYTRFNAYDSNGQSALLQEVKKTIKSRYPKTDIKGDGQAVVINFTDRFYSIDLVPAFEQDETVRLNFPIRMMEDLGKRRILFLSKMPVLFYLKGPMEMAKGSAML